MWRCNNDMRVPLRRTITNIVQDRFNAVLAGIPRVVDRVLFDEEGTATEDGQLYIQLGTTLELVAGLFECGLLAAKVIETVLGLFLEFDSDAPSYQAMDVRFRSVAVLAFLEAARHSIVARCP